MKEEEVNINKFLANNWSIVVGLLAFIFTAGTIFAQFTALQAELTTVHERLDKKIRVINELEDRLVDIEKEIEYEKGFLKGKENYNCQEFSCSCQFGKEFAKLKNCNFHSNIKDACKNADLIILHTEWDEFKSLDFKTEDPDNPKKSIECKILKYEI